jgi:hypothetical protein
MNLAKQPCNCLGVLSWFNLMMTLYCLNVLLQDYCKYSRVNCLYLLINYMKTKQDVCMSH